MPLFDHFNILAPFYDRAIRLKEPERLISLLGLPVEGALLDAGGGTGRVSFALRGMAQPLVVADASHGMLRQAQEKGGLRPVCSHSEDLPFADNTFSRIIMVDALHHVYDHKRTALELWRVLLPGGRIVIEEPDIRTAIVKVVAIGEKLAMMRSHFINPRRIQALFPYSNAATQIVRQGYNAWVIIDKRAL
jgi:ubiquinone/menaquinone biosynthesis C-methylase UbiE